MTLLLTLLAVIIFIVGAYYMGNFMLDSLDNSWPDRIINSLVGILMWFLIGLIILGSVVLYDIIKTN